MAITYGQRTLSDFKARLAGGGARPNLFEVVMSFPEIGGLSAGADAVSSGGGKTTLQEECRFMIKAAELPASNIGDIPVNFRGRILHVAGDRTFDPWTVTVINNTDWALRKTFEDWSDAINTRAFDTGVTDPTAYDADAEIYQLAKGPKEGNVAGGGESKIQVSAGYKFFGMWPSQVSSIAMDYGSTDTIEEFQVTFQIERWAAQYKNQVTFDKSSV